MDIYPRNEQVKQQNKLVRIVIHHKTCVNMYVNVHKCVCIKKVLGWQAKKADKAAALQRAQLENEKDAVRKVAVYKNIVQRKPGIKQC